MDPVGGLVGGFEIGELGDQSVAQHLRLVRASTILGGLITLPFRLAPGAAKGDSTVTGFGGSGA